MKMYFEFSEQEYYGLITVETYQNGYYVEDAAKVYVETVGGESVEDVLEEGEPKQVTKEYAFWKFANCKDVKNYTVKELFDEFNGAENCCIVVDGNLV